MPAAESAGVVRRLSHATMVGLVRGVVPQLAGVARGECRGRCPGRAARHPSYLAPAAPRGARCRPCPIEPRHDVLAFACPNLLSARDESHREGPNRDRGEQEPDRSPRGRMDKAIDIAPLVAMLHHGSRTLSMGTPDPPARDGSHPGRHFAAGPPAAIGGSRGQCLNRLRWLG
jgi:hypothetical protein